MDTNTARSWFLLCLVVGAVSLVAGSVAVLMLGPVWAKWALMLPWGVCLAGFGFLGAVDTIKAEGEFAELYGPGTRAIHYRPEATGCDPRDH